MARDDGPAPFIHANVDGGKGGITAMVVVSMVMLGISESMIFIPFVPLMMHKLKSRGWDRDMAEEAVTAVWTLSWSLGESTGPLIGVALGDLVPRTREARCSSTTVTMDQFMSTFPWASCVYACLSAIPTLLLLLGK